jgi:hypothetical protein
MLAGTGDVLKNAAYYLLELFFTAGAVVNYWGRARKGCYCINPLVKIQDAALVRIGGTSISFAEVHATAGYVGDWQIVAKVRALGAITA